MKNLRILKGFRDFLPAEQQKRLFCIRTFQEIFLSYGFESIDTPALEYSDVLLSKGAGETDKQVYRFFDKGGRDLSLRFDLTVPLARYVAMHQAKLAFPFKRFHIAPVWRGENPQRGRYREFIQCDFDIVGTRSPYSDVEIISTLISCLKALGLGHYGADYFHIRLSHRAFLQSFLKKHQLLDKELVLLRILDKWHKMDSVDLQGLLREHVSSEVLDELLALVRVSDFEMLKKLFEQEEFWPSFSEFWTILKNLGLSEYCQLDLSIMRGLDYYTGLVFETFLDDAPELGSIASGGRYDKLIPQSDDGRDFSGIGGSIGLDRLLSVFTMSPPLGVDVLVVTLTESARFMAATWAQRLRSMGLHVDFSLSQERLPKQFSQAEKRNIRLILLCGEDELQSQLISWRDLEANEIFKKRSLVEWQTYLQKIWPGRLKF